MNPSCSNFMSKQISIDINTRLSLANILLVSMDAYTVNTYLKKGSIHFKKWIRDQEGDRNWGWEAGKESNEECETDGHWDNSRLMVTLTRQTCDNIITNECIEACACRGKYLQIAGKWGEKRQMIGSRSSVTYRTYPCNPIREKSWASCPILRIHVKQWNQNDAHYD